MVSHFVPLPCLKAKVNPILKDFGEIERPTLYKLWSHLFFQPRKCTSTGHSSQLTNHHIAIVAIVASLQRGVWGEAGRGKNTGIEGGGEGRKSREEERRKPNNFLRDC